MPSPSHACRARCLLVLLALLALTPLLAATRAAATTLQGSFSADDQV